MPSMQTAQQKRLGLLPRLTAYAPTVGARVIVYYEEGMPPAVPSAGKIVRIDEEGDEEGMHVTFGKAGTYVVEEKDTWEFDEGRTADREYLRKGMLKLSRETLLGILQQEKFSDFVKFGGGDGVGETEIEIDYDGPIKWGLDMECDGPTITASPGRTTDIRRSEMWWQEFKEDLALHKEFLDTLRDAIECIPRRRKKAKRARV